MQFSTARSVSCRKNLPLSPSLSLSTRECVSTAAWLESTPRREWHCAGLHWALCRIWHSESIPQHSVLVRRRPFQQRLSPCRNLTVADIVHVLFFGSDLFRLLTLSHWKMWKEHFLGALDRRQLSTRWSTWDIEGILGETLEATFSVQIGEEWLIKYAAFPVVPGMERGCRRQMVLKDSVGSLKWFFSLQNQMFKFDPIKLIMFDSHDQRLLCICDPRSFPAAVPSGAGSESSVVWG